MGAQRGIIPVLFGLTLMFGCGPAAAQTLPGQPRGRDRLEAERARYRALMLERVNETMEDWQRAWDSDDAERLAENYSEAGVLFMADGKQTGRQAIQDYFSRMLPTVGPISLSMNEFEAGSPLNLVLSSFLFTAGQGTGQEQEVVGYCITVLMEEEGAWKIRSQVFQVLSGS